MNEKFISEVELKENNTKIKLEYYQIEEPLNEYCSEPKRYGVMVKMKQIYEDGRIFNEGKRIHSLFFRESELEGFIEMLVRNSVTPTTLQEVVEEYIINQLCVEELV